MSLQLVGMPITAQTLFTDEPRSTLSRWQRDGAIDSVFVSNLVPIECAVTRTDQYWHNTGSSPRRGSYDQGAEHAIDDLLTAATELGLRVFTTLAEAAGADLPRTVPEWPSVLEVDAFGRPARQPCLRNPEYQRLWFGIVEQQLKEHSFDGLYITIDRTTPLDVVLGAVGNGAVAGSVCFCDNCQAQAVRERIDIDRAREGWQRLCTICSDQVSQSAGGENPFVLVLRILLEFPEILAWEALWMRGLLGLQQQLYGVAKLLAPDAQVGWQLPSARSSSPLHQALDPLATRTSWADFCCQPVVSRATVKRPVLGVDQAIAEAFAASVLRGDSPTETVVPTGESGANTIPPVYFSVNNADVLDQVFAAGGAGLIYTDSLAASSATQQLAAAGDAVRKRR